MVFSSPIFLFIFLPSVWLIHALLPENFRKAFLLLASLVFYIYGEAFFVILMLATIVTAHLSTVMISRSERHKKAIAVTGSCLAISVLVIFKYVNFFTLELSRFLALFSSVKITPTNFHLPLGISFFTFQAVSCIIDFYRNPKEKEPKFIDTALYISFFPQLVAGPIVRYDNFMPQLKYRAVHYAAFLYGMKRFIYGFAKKVLISNNVASIVDKIYSTDPSSMGSIIAWVAPILFGIQLYFDFSGYSDMAIGLARIFGIKIPENFNYPFAATSISNLWRRWHISLSTWFRDYLYIPMGGSRKGEARTIFNLWFVFAICGLWHGAAWHFVLFGIITSFVITIERFYKKHFSFKSAFLSHLYVVIIIFPLFFGSFRADTLAQFFGMLRAMFVPTAPSAEILQLFDTKSVIIFAIGFIFSFPIYGLLTDKFGKSNTFKWLEAAFLLVLFGAALSSGTIVFSDPFLYFRF